MDNTLNCLVCYNEYNPHNFILYKYQALCCECNKNINKQNLKKKICNTCKIEKDRFNFHQGPSYIDGYRSQCKDCLNNKRNNRLKESLNLRIGQALRVRLNIALKKNLIDKKISHISDLGCTIEEFKEHIENQFEPGMTWNNWGVRGWHIDHKLPLSKYDLSNPEEAKKVIHYTNLQPLWAKKNLSKGNR